MPAPQRGTAAAKRRGNWLIFGIFGVKIAYTARLMGTRRAKADKTIADHARKDIKMKHKNAGLIKIVFLKTLPVMVGYLVLGMGFGILLEDKGYGALWAFAMSVTMYAGSMQYVAVDLLASGASLISAAIMTVMVNARHLFYGISMIDRYKGAGRKKPYLMFALTDETYSLICSEKVPEGVNPHLFYFLISLFDQCYWITGATLGAVVGSLIQFSTAGVDFAMTALFVSIFTEQWLTSRQHTPALIGVLATLGCLLLFGADRFLIPAMLVILTALCTLRPKIEKNAAKLAEEDAHAKEAGHE